MKKGDLIITLGRHQTWLAGKFTQNRECQYHVDSHRASSERIVIGVFQSGDARIAPIDCLHGKCLQYLAIMRMHQHWRSFCH